MKTQEPTEPTKPTEIDRLRRENRALRESLRALSRESGEAVVRAEILVSKNDDGSMSQVLVVSYPLLDPSKEEKMCKRFVRTFHALLGLEPVSDPTLFGRDSDEVSS